MIGFYRNNNKPTNKSSGRKFKLILPLLFLSSVSYAAPVINYGENLNNLKFGMNNKSLHILQIGDSHTAGDYFTEQLRKRLQTDLGDGGIGFAYPAKLSGQRSARHGYKSEWKTHNSRFNKSGGDYPVGGVFATPNSNQSELTVTSKYYAGGKQNAEFVVFANSGQKITLDNRFGVADITLKENGWQSFSIPLQFPTSIKADASIKLGGFWLRKNNRYGTNGGVVSSMGINGATQDYWRRWQSDVSHTIGFSKADLVILAYGTNEAFRNNASNLTSEMTSAINTIRRGLPNAVILVVGAPESLKNTAGNCGQRATSLDSVQKQLKYIAHSNRTLYWDWQDAMGGTCSMKNWVNNGLAAKDGVHFSRKGYSKAANDLYNNLKASISSEKVTNYNSTANPNAVKSINLINNNIIHGVNEQKLQNTGKGNICKSNGECVTF